LEKDAPVSRAVKLAGTILCRPVLGGLHHQYVRIWFTTGTGIPPLTREQAELFHAQAPDWQLAEGKAHRLERRFRFPGAYLPSKYPRINSRFRSWRRMLR